MKNLIILLLFIPTFIFGQTWEKKFGGENDDIGYSVQQTSDGGYIIAGSYQYENGSHDTYLIKTDDNGDTLWTKRYGGDGWEHGHSIQQTTDGGFVITGSSNSFSDGDDDVYMIKTDNNGDTIWTRVYGGEYNDEGWSIQQTTDGGYIVAGNNNGGGPGDDIYIVKTDAFGESMWTRTFGGTGIEQGYSIQQTTDGGYIIAGYTNSFGIGNNDIYLIKTDNNGDTLWTKTYGGDGWEQGHSVQQTTDGGFIITGSTNSYGPGDFNVFLLKTDNDGNQQWNHIFVDEYDDEGFSVQQTNDGGYVITGLNTGRSFDYNYFEDVFLIKTDSAGNELWTRLLGEGNNNSGYSINQTNDNGYIITGYSQIYGAGSNGSDVLLIKTDENGIITSTTEISIPNPNRKLVKRVNISGREILKPKNKQPYIEIYDDGTTEKKMKLK